MNKEFGWDLLYHCVESCVTRKEDVLITFVHFVLIKNGFRCHGYDGEVCAESDDGTELLPLNWHTKESLSLKYKLKKQNYVLQVVKSQGKIIVNLLDPDRVEASNVVFEIDSNVCQTKGSLRTVMPKYTEVWGKVENGLLHPILPEIGEKRKTENKASSSEDRKPPEWTPSNPRPSAQRDSERENFFDPFGVGRSDLDPLGRLGGGMILQPPRRGGIMPGLGVPGGLPRAAVPPGARFDPFGPPDLDRPHRGPSRGPGRLSNPDHDHLPPPGYDDMFM